MVLSTALPVSPQVRDGMESFDEPMSSGGAAPARLTVIDEIFLRTHRGLGTPIALQGVWRTADRVEAAMLEDLHARLRHGPLGRRVVRARVPGARRLWQPTTRAYPLDLGREMASTELLDWADTLGTDLDPEYGPGWRLSAAPVDDGGTVIALTCSHVLADARGLLIAVDTALRGLAIESVPSAGPGSEWADAGRQLATVLGGTAAAIGTGLARVLSRTATRASPRRAESMTDAAAPDRARRGPTVRPGVPDEVMPTVGVVLRIPAENWDRAAAGSDGTPNSLFVWFVANVLWASGFPSSVIEAALPVDTRDEPRVDNDLAMTSIAVTPSDSPADIRAKSRAAYERRMTSPAGLPEQTLQLVSDRLAYAMSRGAGERDILCSNIGALPPSLHTFGPHDCTGIAARAIHPGLTFARRPRTRLSGYLSRTSDTYTLALVGLDPTLIPSSGVLRTFAEDMARSLELPIGGW
ncbi:hypothetical protein [Nocardia cyriacigeorgica]|uniref:hypothetical protein n=1 Tax=Nocardia cyriacigeorgica TaxID=135487 RepID=UPI00158E715C|nr:hypothetical protein [Nocardia cyriacigeorgica]